MAETNLTGDVLAPPALRGAVEKEAAEWGPGGRLGRLWQRDPGVWTGGDEGRWLGWLDVPDPDGPEVRRLDAFVDRLRRDGFVSAALLGMGGSSLCPEMLQRIFGSASGVELRVLDSTDPAQVRAFESTLDLDRTLFVVSSKSGTTLETSLLHAYFFERVSERAGVERAGSRFVAVTDPGSALDRLATDRGFRAVFHGEPTIGGRYSALSYFGLAPAALAGLDLRLLLARARAMADACGPESPVSENPGVQLGLLLGSAARAGRDKATLVTSTGLDGFGAWIEQLLAESTGKDGRGIIPVDGERLEGPAVYGDDRVFVATTLNDEPDERREEALDGLARAGSSRGPHPRTRPVRHRRGVLSLGARHGGGGRGARRAPLRSAGTWKRARPRPARSRAGNPRAGARRRRGRWRSWPPSRASSPRTRRGRTPPRCAGRRAPTRRCSSGSPRTCAACAPGATSPCWPTSRCANRIGGSSTTCATRCGPRRGWRRRSASGHASCTPRARPTRAARETGCS